MTAYTMEGASIVNSDDWGGGDPTPLVPREPVVGPYVTSRGFDAMSGGVLSDLSSGETDQSSQGTQEFTGGNNGSSALGDAVTAQLVGRWY